jgi:hypothetical protein
VKNFRGEAEHRKAPAEAELQAAEHEISVQLIESFSGDAVMAVSAGEERTAALRAEVAQAEHEIARAGQVTRHRRCRSRPLNC